MSHAVLQSSRFPNCRHLSRIVAVVASVTLTVSRMVERKGPQDCLIPWASVETVDKNENVSAES